MKTTKPLRTGESVSLYAAALVFVFAAAVMLMTCWPAAIPFGIGAAFLACWAYFRSPTLIVTAESVTISQPRRGVHAEFPWSRYRCLYRLEGVNRTLLVLAPEPCTKDELRAIVADYKKLRSPVPELHGCLVLHDGRTPVSVLARIPDSVQRMPYSDCISL